MNFLGKMCNFLLETTADTLENNYKNSWFYDIVGPLVKILDSLLVPVIILLGVAGSIYGIVLGVKYSKAEGDKREEVKRQLINAIIGIVISLIILIAMKIFVNQAKNVAGWIFDSAGISPNGGGK